MPRRVDISKCPEGVESREHFGTGIKKARGDGFGLCGIFIRPHPAFARRAELIPAQRASPAASMAS